MKSVELDCTHERCRVGLYTWNLLGCTLHMKTVDLDGTHENCIVELYTWQLRVELYSWKLPSWIVHMNKCRLEKLIISV